MKHRCVVHLDLDCFYAQVEALRLGIDFRTEPYVLSQWGNLIAVNYPARRCGIKRFNSLTEAIAKCPGLKYSHVATFLVGESDYKYHPNPKNATHKVSLDPYREASRNIFAVLGSTADVVVEKGGVDEAFLDVTRAAQRWLEHHGFGDAAALQQHWDSSVEQKLLEETDTRLPPDRAKELDAFLNSSCDRTGLKPLVESVVTDPAHRALLFAATVITKEIRDRVRRELGFDCSAGIATNRLLSKCISALFKPNQQTLLLPEAVNTFLFDFEFAKLRPFGGKWGQEISSRMEGSVTCGDLWRFPLSEFQAKLAGSSDPKQGEYVFWRVRGHCDAPVEPVALAKSLISQKNFSPPTSDKTVIQQWFTVLAKELMDRLTHYSTTNGMTAHSLNVKLGQSGLSDSADVGNKTFQLPIPTSTERVVDVAMRYATQLMSVPSPPRVNIVTMTIGEFRKTDASNDAMGAKQMTLSQMFRQQQEQKNTAVVRTPMEKKNFSSTTSSSSRSGCGKRSRDEPEEEEGADSDHDVVVAEDDVVVISDDEDSDCEVVVVQNVLQPAQRAASSRRETGDHSDDDITVLS